MTSPGTDGSLRCTGSALAGTGEATSAPSTRLITVGRSAVRPQRSVGHKLTRARYVGRIALPDAPTGPWGPGGARARAGAGCGTARYPADSSPRGMETARKPRPVAETRGKYAASLAPTRG